MGLSCNKTPVVCFFDSGIGGINLLYECVRRLPKAEFFYFADNFRVPYGNIADNELNNLVDAFFKDIKKLNPDVAVVACNTVTASCIKFLRSKYNFPIVGVQPAVKPAAESKERCAVLATPSTICSASLNTLIKYYGNGLIEPIACRDLAYYIENNIFNLNRGEVFKHLPNTDIKNIIIGCTHYGYIKKYLKEFYGGTVFDGAEGTVNRICKILGIFDHPSKIGSKITFCGGDACKNQKVFDFLVAENGL